jgi:hypothetical protein
MKTDRRRTDAFKLIKISLNREETQVKMSLQLSSSPLLPLKTIWQLLTSTDRLDALLKMKESLSS